MSPLAKLKALFARTEQQVLEFSQTLQAEKSESKKDAKARSTAEKTLFRVQGVNHQIADLTLLCNALKKLLPIIHQTSIQSIEIKDLIDTTEQELLLAKKRLSLSETLSAKLRNPTIRSTATRQDIQKIETKSKRTKLILPKHIATALKSMELASKQTSWEKEHIRELGKLIKELKQKDVKKWNDFLRASNAFVAAMKKQDGTRAQVAFENALASLVKNQPKQKRA